jgi:flagellar hook-associated protein 3 FlgL
MRVSLRNQYSNFLYNLQKTQSRLMDLNMQASSQKRINKPSDDPVGTGRVLNYRSSLASIDQYRKNIDTAKGWLNLADESMMQVSTLMTKLKGLAEQGATGTMAASDREATSYEVRQIFSQLINLANTRYEGKSIFGGQKFEGSAFDEALMVYDQDGKSLGLAEGAGTRSMVVKFVPSSVTNSAGDVIPVADEPACRFSADGGKTWQDGTWSGGKLNLGGVSLTPTLENVTLSAVDSLDMSTGTWLTIAPTAVYKGDHESQAAVEFTGGGEGIDVLLLGGFERGVRNVSVTAASNVHIGDKTAFNVTVEAMVNGQLQVWNSTVPNTTEPCGIETPYGTVQLSGQGELQNLAFSVKSGSTRVLQMGAEVNAEGRGLFADNVMVRIASVTATEIYYTHSTDNGTTWSDERIATITGGNSSELLVPGGKLVLAERNSAFSLAAGNQFIIHPQTAAHNVEISAGQYVQLNNIGSEIFGGYYENGTQPVFSDSDVGKNIMVTVGKLVAALENNDQQGCAEALDGLKKGQQYFTTQLASVGARENRLEVADTVLSGLKLNETERMSNVEDADLAALLTELANQQLSYEAVLKSSSMIMKMSLVNYL